MTTLQARRHAYDPSPSAVDAELDAAKAVVVHSHARPAEEFALDPFAWRFFFFFFFYYFSFASLSSRLRKDRSFQEFFPFQIRAALSFLEKHGRVASSKVPYIRAV
jgi:hypothetical protein